MLEKLFLHIAQTRGYLPCAQEGSRDTKEVTTLGIECSFAKQNGKELDEVIDVLRGLCPLKAAFPLLVKLIQIAFIYCS